MQSYALACIVCGMAYRAAVVGGSGYTGAELLRLLAAHPDVEVVAVTADSNVGSRVAEQFPSLAAAYPKLEYGPVETRELAGLDVVFLALPHGKSQDLAGELVDAVAHVVDLGADFRLPEADYETWYHEPHRAPGLLERFAFGLPELYRRDNGAARHASAPGSAPARPPVP